MEREVITRNLGQNIRKYRIKSQLSQEALALHAGIHPAYLGRLERGEKCPTVDTVFKISDALSISVSDLLVFEEVPDATAATTRITNVLSKLPPRKQALLTDIIESLVTIIAEP